MWYRVTRYARVFRRLTAGKQTPRFWGVTIVACHIDALIFDYLFKATTLHSRTMILGQACFIPYSMKMSDLFMMVL